MPIEWTNKGIIYTTGEVARICQVAPRTVSKWFDAGLIGGFRIPGGTDRRITRDSLIEFMGKNGMPMEWLHIFERELKREN